LEHCWSLSRRILFDCIMWLGCAIPCRCALLVYSAGWSARSAVRSSVPSTVGPARPSRPSMTSADGASLPLAGAPARRQATPRRPAPPACPHMTSGATHSPHAPRPPLPLPAAHACFPPVVLSLLIRTVHLHLADAFPAHRPPPMLPTTVLSRSAPTVVPANNALAITSAAARTVVCLEAAFLAAAARTGSCPRVVVHRSDTAVGLTRCHAGVE